MNGMKAHYFCESCGSEVKAGAKVCPSCGKVFVAVRCPKCGFEGGERDFANGCPSCGYLDAIPRPGSVRTPAAPRSPRQTAARHGAQRRPSSGLPAWAWRVILAVLAVAAVVLLGVIVFTQ